MPNGPYNPQMPNNQYNPQMPNGPYNPQMPNNQYNPQMPEQQMSNLDYIPPNNQPVPDAPNNQVPNDDFQRVNTQEATNTQSNVDNTQHYYNPPTENNQEEIQNMSDTQDTNIQENASDDLNNEQNPSEYIPQENITDNPNDEEKVTDSMDENHTEAYYNMDNLGTNHDTVEKATAYWLGERFQSEYKPPFTMYIFDNAEDAEKALLELPYIHKAIDTGKLICDEVFIYGYYKVADANYEAIICGKDLTYEQFTQAEKAFEKYGGKRKNNLEPEKTSENIQQQPSDNNTQNKESSVKFREKITKDQFTYECYDADNKNDALEFLKQQVVNQRLYYICVYTPEGDYGKDIDGVYQM